MKCAVVEVAARQFLVEEGQIIDAPKLSGNSAGDQVCFDNVLLYWDGKKLELGKPYLKGYSVSGKVLEETRGPKVTVYKFKRRKGYHKKAGHRQDVFRVEITGITGKKPTPKKDAAPDKSGKE